MVRPNRVNGVLLAGPVKSKKEKGQDYDRDMSILKGYIELLEERLNKIEEIAWV